MDIGDAAAAAGGVGISAIGDENGVDVLEIPFNSVWKPEEDDVENKVVCFWVITDLDRVPDRAKEPSEYIPFVPNEESNGELMFLNITIWAHLRQKPQDLNQISWEQYRQLADSEKEKWRATLYMLDENGKARSWVLKKPNGVFYGCSNPHDYFDYMFEKGQAMAENTAKDPSHKLWAFWECVPHKWLKRTGGRLDACKGDTRSYEEVSGFAFRPLKKPVAPDPKGRYVKLRASAIQGNWDGEARTLTMYDDGAKAMGIRFTQIYVEDKTLKILGKEGESQKYLDKNAGLIAIRNEAGQIQYLNTKTPRGEYRQPIFWQQARDHGLTKLGSKACRSRNVDGLKLCFVAKSDFAEKNLEAAVEQAKSQAVVAVKQTVIVVGSVIAKPSGYDYLLSTSPFNDYETWISQKDYISYLQKYPGYSLPNVEKLKEINEKLEKMVYRKSAPPRKRRRVTPEGVNENSVSFQTILAAAGTRGGAQDQIQVMGGSASEIALTAGWVNEATKKSLIPGCEVGSLKWDSPGIHAAEWLHRSAYSFGRLENPFESQTMNNLIFGSSEANSLMTRYEQAWQLLFVKDNELRKHWDATVAKPNIIQKTHLQGVLRTRNTCDDTPILMRRLTDVNLLEEYILKITTRKAGKTIRVTKNGAEIDPPELLGKPIPDYWDATQNHQNLCFALEYTLMLERKPLLNIGSSLLTTKFYPFERGFYTRIESDVDKILLSKMYQLGISNIGGPSPAVINFTPTPIIKISKQASGATRTFDCQEKPLAINNLALRVVDASSKKAVTLTSIAEISSRQAPADLPTASLWKKVTAGVSITVGGVELSDLALVTADEKGRMMHVPIGNLPPRKQGLQPISPSKRTAMVAKAPFRSFDSLTADTSQLPTEKKSVTDLQGPWKGSDGNNLPSEFVLHGTIKLFGLIEEPIYVLNGSETTGQRQIIPLKAGTVKLPDYLPALSSPPFDAIQLQNVQLVYNQLTTTTEESGTWLQTDLIFSGPLQPISDFFKNICGQDRPMLRVEALLGPYNDWSKPIQCASIGFRGSLPNMSAKIGDILEITDLGVNVGFTRQREMWKPFDEKWISAFGVFGKMKVDMPKEMAPMDVDFAMNECQGMLTLTAQVKDDECSKMGFAGIEGLKLNKFSLMTTLDLNSKPSLVQFSTDASIKLREMELTVEGYYSKSDWGFFCTVNNLDLSALADMYEDLFDTSLHIAPHEVVIENVEFTAGPLGIFLEGKVTVEGYQSAKGKVALDRNGISISGSVEDVQLPEMFLPGGNLVVIKHAALDVFVGRKRDTTVTGPGTSWRFAISGIIEIGHNSLSAGLYLDKSSGGKLLWTVYGEFAGAIQLSNIEPSIQGSDFDFALSNVALIISNTGGSASTGVVIPAAYSVGKGVQIAAKIGPIASIDGAMGNKGAPTTGLTLSAVYTSGTQFEIRVLLPSPQSMSMKKGLVYSGPIFIGIEVGMKPALVLQADFFVRVPPENAPPLKFSGGISLGLTEAKLFLQSKDQYWNNPFGLSKQLSLGPNFGLDIGFQYVSEFYPTELGIAAGIQIGNVKGTAALMISESPNDELIDFRIQELGIRDLVDFASRLLEQELPVPDEDFLRFKDVHFYLSSGATIGTIAYPPGASFNCDATIFGHETTVFVGVNKGQGSIQVSGTLDAFEIGPVSIGGYETGTKAQLSLQFSPTLQSFILDGGIIILDTNARVKVDVKLLPTPVFDLAADVNFSSHFNFFLDAKMQGGNFSGGIDSLKALDFDVHASFHQDILEYIETEMNMQILIAKHAVDDGIEKAEATLKRAEKDFEDAITDAVAKLDIAETALRVKTVQAEEALLIARKNFSEQIQKRKAAVDSAQAVWEDAVKRAGQALQQAMDRRTTSIRDAQEKLCITKADADRRIDEATKKLNDSKTDMQTRFGDAIKKVDDADRNAKNLDRSLLDTEKALSDAKRAANRAKGFDWFKKAALVTKLGFQLVGLKTAVETAHGVLSAAKKVIEGAGYKSAEIAIAAAQGTLDAAKETANASIVASNATLKETIVVANASVRDAQLVLEAVRSTGVEKMALETANRVLDDLMQTERLILSNLQAAVDVLSSCTEAVAFKSAQAFLAAAQANTHDIEIAQSALEVAKTSADAITMVGDWVTKNTVNILNLETIELTGDLRAICLKESELKAHVVGKFAGQNVDINADFSIGKGEEFLKRMFERLMADVKAGIISIIG